MPGGNTQKPIEWLRGPAAATLAGDTAEIKIPEGFAYVSAEAGARQVLKRMNYAVPNELAGIVVPVGGGVNWVVILEYKELGHIKDEGKETLDPAAMLNTLHQQIERQQIAKGLAPTVPPMDWLLPPRYDVETHTMEWALSVQNGASKVINRGIRLFGRKGFIDGSTVQPDRVSLDTIPLNRLMEGVAFTKGYAYQDFRKGDKLSALALSDIFTIDAPENKSGPNRKIIFAAAAGMILLCGGSGSWVVRRRILNKRKLAAEKEAAYLASRPVPTFKSGAESVPVKPSVASRPAIAPVGRTNGKQNGHVRRRRIFDYQKYYSDLMMQVSDRSYDRAFEIGIIGQVKNGNGSSNGNGHTNGVAHKPRAANGHVPETNHNVPDTGAAKQTVGSSLDLIASQTNLIEEQQRLIREQTKLIEEKTRLIHEKNQVLEKQAELFGNNTF